MEYLQRAQNIRNCIVPPISRLGWMRPEKLIKFMEAIMSYSIKQTAPGKFEITDEHSIYWHEGTRASAEAFIQSVHRRNLELDALSEDEFNAMYRELVAA
jgi:predicted Rdx family selenoprotein